MSKPIKVTIDAEGNIKCNPDIYDRGKSWRSYRIKWRMKTDGWEITGITDPHNNPLSEDVFYSSKKSGKTGWKIKDKNPREQDFYYMVHVKKIDTGECKAHDPIIRNKGRKVE